MRHVFKALIAMTLILALLGGCVAQLYYADQDKVRKMELRRLELQLQMYSAATQ